MFLCVLIAGCSQVNKKDKLRARITAIATSTDATIGVGIMDLMTGDTITFNGNRHFPMQSVYKFHLAMAVLSVVDSTMHSLNHGIFVKKSELHEDTHSPMRDDFPKGDSTFSLSTILEYTVSRSDNNGCDILFRFVGGPEFVNQYVRTLGVSGVVIAETEEQMRQAWDVQFKNWTTPSAMTEVLAIYSRQMHLSKKSSEFLWKIMVESPTGANRIKAQLPSTTIVAHKTGTSGVNEDGIRAAVNDVGIVRLPDGRQYAISVFVSNTKD
ncbi:MAG TPA: class A beta-lactamase, subclass A2, partial [Cyclobacteriaceae bacterium]|nr:class A beta-lactamase, subclass A2 [Cyclobacteriaceae bacterium]